MIADSKVESNSRVRVQAARLRDDRLVAKVIRKSFAEYRNGRRSPRSASISKGRVRREMRKGDRRYGLAFLGERAVGAIGYKTRAGRLTFGPVGVLPEYRGRGVGAALVRWIEERAKEEKCRRLQAQVLRGLSSLVRFYERLGYRTVKNRKGQTFAVKRIP